MTETAKCRKFKTIDLAYIALGAALIAVCSWISIPTTVPFTMQTFAVFFVLAALGGRRGTLSVLVYTDFFPESHKYAGILSEPFGFATVNRDYTATVPDTVFWAYHLLHCLKHYYGKGIGLRRVLDLYFLAPEMAKTADTGYVDELLQENGLYEDIKDLFAVAKYCLTV